FVSTTPHSTPPALFPNPTLSRSTAGTLTVLATDPYGNVDPTYAGTVHFTSSDGQAILPADGPLTNGVGTFNVTLLTAGTQSITATGTATASLPGTHTAPIASSAS